MVKVCDERVSDHREARALVEKARMGGYCTADYAKKKKQPNAPKPKHASLPFGSGSLSVLRNPTSARGDSCSDSTFLR